MLRRVITSKEFESFKVLDSSNSNKILTTELVDKAEIVNSKTGEYVIKQDVKITSSIDTQEYIQSFADDVGIENILKKFDLVKDPELLNQVTRPTVPIAEDGKEVVQDYTGLPANEEEALKLAVQARDEFNSLPEDLVKGRSFSEFAESCTKEELLAYIQGTQKKEGE